MNATQRIRLGLLLTNLKLGGRFSFRTFTSDKDYPKDPDPKNWRTINGSKVHLTNGKIDGGAGEKFQGNEWHGKVAHGSNSHFPPKGWVKPKPQAKASEKTINYNGKTYKVKGITETPNGAKYAEAYWLYKGNWHEVKSDKIMKALAQEYEKPNAMLSQAPEPDPFGTEEVHLPKPKAKKVGLPGLGTHYANMLKGSYKNATHMVKGGVDDAFKQAGKMHSSTAQKGVFIDMLGLDNSSDAELAQKVFEAAKNKQITPLAAKNVLAALAAKKHSLVTNNLKKELGMSTAGSAPAPAPQPTKAGESPNKYIAEGIIKQMEISGGGVGASLSILKAAGLTESEAFDVIDVYDYDAEEGKKYLTQLLDKTGVAPKKPAMTPTSSPVAKSATTTGGKAQNSIDLTKAKETSQHWEDMDEDDQSKYLQDLSGKFNIPTEKAALLMDLLQKPGFTDEKAEAMIKEWGGGIRNKPSFTSLPAAAQRKRKAEFDKAYNSPETVWFSTGTHSQQQKDAQEHFGPIVSKWHASMTPEEKMSVVAYTGSSYDAMNNFLRGKTSKPSSNTLEKIKNADKALDKTEPNKTTLRLRRGVNSGVFDLIKNASDGIFIDQGYTSTSPCSKGGFSGNEVEIIIPKGVGKGAWVDDISSHKGELEYILPRGAKFQVCNIEENNGKKKAQLILLGFEPRKID